MSKLNNRWSHQSSAARSSRYSQHTTLCSEICSTYLPRFQCWKIERNCAVEGIADAQHERGAFAVAAEGLDRNSGIGNGTELRLDPAFGLGYIGTDIEYKIAAGTDRVRELGTSRLVILSIWDFSSEKIIEKIILSSRASKMLNSLEGFCLGGRVTSGEILTSSGDGSRFRLAS
jgi:hypothetical protein